MSLNVGSFEYMEFYKNKIINLLKSCNRDGISDLINFLESSDFFTAPASQYFHANHPSGLAFHSYSLYTIASAYNKMHKLDIPEESIIIASICHDLCKIGNYNLETKYKKDKNNKWQSYLTYGNNNLSQCQHGPQSALMASRYIKLTEMEEQAICWHMSSYGQSDVDNRMMNKSMDKHPLVLIIQQADMASAHFYEKVYPVDQIPGLGVSL